jgi:hypothetical protein
MYKDFEAVGMKKYGPDVSIHVENTNGQMMICTEEHTVFITRDQAVEFFGLVPQEALQGLVPIESVAMFHMKLPTPVKKDGNPTDAKPKANKPNKPKLRLV